MYCGGDLAVNNSRPQKNRNQTWRRRLCKACGAVFTSIESIDLSQALIVQNSGHNDHSRNHSVAKIVSDPTGLVAFDRDRIFISLYKSLQHRTSAASDARGLADTIIAHILRDIQNQNKSADSKINQIAVSRISSRTIAETILNTLKRFDQAAATHYAAFHKPNSRLYDLR